MEVHFVCRQRFSLCVIKLNGQRLGSFISWLRDEVLAAWMLAVNDGEF